MFHKTQIISLLFYINLLGFFIYQSEALANVKLLDSNSQSVTLEFTTTNTNEQLKSVLIAIPKDSKLKLNILESEPAAINQPVKIGITGAIREQGVAQILFSQKYKRLRVKVSFSNSTRSASNQAVLEDSPAYHRILQGLLINDATANRVLRRNTTRSNCPPPPLPALKLSIDKTGLYAITYADFLEAGLDMSTFNAEIIAQIHMTNNGKAVPIFIAGEEDGNFGKDDILYFYAQAAKGAYTRENVYWLSLKADGGLRINFSNESLDSATPLVTEFTKTVHVEQNKIYWSKLPDINKDHLFWAQLDAKKSLKMPITLQHVAKTGKNATIRVMLQGKTNDYQHNPNHHTKILLNGVEIHDAKWAGQIAFLQEVSVPQTSLQEGKNTVTLQSVGDTGATVDSIYVNWLEIDYTATTTAIQDQLVFKISKQGAYNLKINGFSKPEILVLDVTEQQQILPLLGTKVSADNNGGYQIEFDNKQGGNQTYYAFTIVSENLNKPDISLNLPTTRLQSACNQADYFIIHHDSFDVKALENFIVKNRGLKVMAVPVSKIYNEFNHGMPDPQAIKDFLTYAYQNYTQPRPAYVVLVGDANQDTLNELGHGINYIPTYTFHTYALGETATDNWFVTISGDDPLPDMFLGRLPIRTQAELDALVNKFTNYSQAPLDGWQRNVVFVADNDTADFEATSNWLIEKHLTNYSSKQIYLSKYANKSEAVKQEIIQQLNTGAIVTNYTGHGSITNWAGEFIFQSSDVKSLNNSDKLTFVVALNCLNGWFSYYQPFYGSDDSLAEAFLKADGKGAIAVLAPTGLGYTSQHEELASELFQRLFENKETELGSLTTAAKIAAVTNSGISKDNLEMFTLFGEPSMQLRLE